MKNLLIQSCLLLLSFNVNSQTSDTPEKAKNFIDEFEIKYQENLKALEESNNLINNKREDYVEAIIEKIESYWHKQKASKVKGLYCSVNIRQLTTGEIVSISINSEDGLPLSVDMPTSVILEIKHTEPGIKGNTATNANKPATVETGAKINVPLFINEGDKIKVDTEKASYIERIKE